MSRNKIKITLHGVTVILNGVTSDSIWSNIGLNGRTCPLVTNCVSTIWRNDELWKSMSRAVKPKNNRKIPTQPIQPRLQIKRYLVKCKRKPTGDSTRPNKRSSIVVDGSDWEDITTDDSSSDSVSHLNQQPPKMLSKGGTATIPTLNTGLNEMEERLHTKLTSSLTANITENLRSFIDSKLDEALNKMTESMVYLVANDSSLQQQKEEMVCLKVDNKRLTAKVLTLEIEQNKLKTKLDRMEQKSLDHCLVI